MLVMLWGAVFSVQAQEAEGAAPGWTNGDFEQAGAEGNWPADWERTPDSPITWESENGMHFLRMVAAQPELTIAQSRILSLPPEIKGLDLGIKFRVANFKFGMNGAGKPSFSKDMHFNYQFLDAEGNPVPKSGGGFVLDSHAKDWMEVTRRALVPEGAAKLKVSQFRFYRLFENRLIRIISRISMMQ
jgi:hypothetical protein